MSEIKKARHGDCGLHIGVQLPKNAVLLDSDICRCATFEACPKHGALAHGEVSGHTHLLETPLPMYEHEGSIFFVNNTDKPVSVAQTEKHQMTMDIARLEKTYAASDLHAPMKEVIPAKTTVKVVFPQEFNWFTGEIERARD